MKHALIKRWCARAAMSLLAGGWGLSAHAAVYGEHLEGFTQPYPLQHYHFTSQQQTLDMGYLDVSDPSAPSKGVVVLMHGKNFCAATWDDTIKVLVKAHYRVIAPDQIGFCSSSKPQHYQYTFQQLAANTHALLASLGITKASVLGHSTGGMLAMRYALQYPAEVSQLLLVNPIGLEDWKAMGVPYRTVDQWYQRELALDANKIRQYEQQVYYVGRWKPEYDKWVDMLAGLNQGPGHPLVAWNSALIYDMIFTQPVFYEMGNIQPHTTLFIGDADTTAIGSDIAPPAIKKTLGHYKELGERAARLIPHATLVSLPGLGHAPQIEQPDKFNQLLLQALESR